jgi:D-alanyl-D-alanine carboxypeptidase/D-alanyl-D-alanine-endopeptidase (penicillin-binding protein 4)
VRLLRALCISVALGGCTTVTPLPPVPSPVPVPVPPPDVEVHVEPPLTGRAALRATLDSITGDTLFRSAVLGVLVLDADTHDTLYARNPFTAVMPASNMKLITGATALVRLGPDYRYRTTFVLRGAIADSTLRGDLLVFGRGDPTISQRMRGNPMLVLGGIADSMRARGVARVNGRLVHAGNAFQGPIHGFGWEWDDLSQSYGAGVDELLFNEGLAFVPGHPTGGDTLTTDAAADPAAAYLAALRAALAGRGVSISGATGRDSLAVPAGTDRAFDLLSPPLREILPHVEKPSQNQMAEVLFRTLALELTGTGRTDSAARMVTDQLLEWGADTMQFIVRDGSGLSRHNLVSPATIVRLLLAMREHDTFDVFYWSLPAVGIEGTVRTWLRGSRASEVVRGKTGTLNMVRAFSGYAESLDRRPIVFSFIANHYRTPTAAVTRAIQGMLRALTETPLSQ